MQLFTVLVVSMGNLKRPWILLRAPLPPSPLPRTDHAAAWAKLSAHGSGILALKLWDLIFGDLRFAAAASEGTPRSSSGKSARCSKTPGTTDTLCRGRWSGA